MPPASPEQRFLDFRRGDRAALGDVFDRCAPELLRVAAHACGSVASAEDAVQATFVAAIEHAARWDETRPLMPWLIGILGNQLRAQRAQAGRRVDPQRVRLADDAAPDLAAIAAEFDAELSRALDRLPTTYRTPLVLHLRHGLSAAEIAHANDQPASTVRNQLARGLEQLRSLLPAGIASTLALTLTPTRGLAAVKAATLTAVGTPTALAATAITMKAVKSLACIALCAALALGIWSLTPPSDAPTAAPDAAPTTAKGAATAPPATPQAPAREAAAAPAPQPAMSANLRGKLRDERGVAIAGARIVAIDLQREPATPAATTPLTAADGSFALRLPAGEWALRSESALAAPAQARIRTHDDQLATVELTAVRGEELRGRIVDDRGQPLAGASVGVRRKFELSPGTLQLENPSGACAVSDAAGRFRLGGIDAPHVELFAAAAGHQPKMMHAHQREVEVRLDRLGALAVRVRDAAGKPVVGARLAVTELDAHPPALDATAPRTDADGRAHLAALAPFTSQLHVSADGFQPAALRVHPEPGQDTDIDVTLAAGARVFVQVRDHLGRPLPRARVVACSSAQRGAGVMTEHGDAATTLRPIWGERQHAQADDRGIAVLTGLAPDTYALRAATTDAVSVLDTMLECRANADLSAELQVQPYANLIVRVRQANGTPASAKLHLDLATASYQLAADVDTDAAGICTLQLPAGKATIGTAHADAEGTSIELLPGQSTELEVRPPTRLEHVVAVRDGATPVAGALVMLAKAADVPEWQRFVADHDGRAMLTALTAGTYRGLFSRHDGAPQSEFELTVQGERVQGPSVLLLPSGSVRLTLRSAVGPVVDAELRAYQLTHKSGRTVTMTRRGRAAESLQAQSITAARSDQAGVLVLRDVPTGSHQVEIVHESFLIAPLSVEVGAGETTQDVMLQPAGSVQVALRRADGSTGAPAQILIEPADGVVTGSRTRIELAFDAQVKVGSLAPGRYALRAVALSRPGGRPDPVLVEVRLGSMAEATLVVPD